MITNDWVLIETEPYRLNHPYKASWVCPNATHKAILKSDIKSGDKVIVDCYRKDWDFHSEKAAQNWNFDRPSTWSWRTVE